METLKRPISGITRLYSEDYKGIVLDFNSHAEMGRYLDLENIYDIVDKHNDIIFEVKGIGMLHAYVAYSMDENDNLYREPIIVTIP